jgi:voltage-gated potassium channel
MLKYFFDPVLNPHSGKGWRDHWFRIIFRHDTKAGLRFDITLIWVILASVAITIIDSVVVVHTHYSRAFYVLEWAFTIFFLIEYIVRLLVLDKPLRYAKSALGIIDVLAILPAFLSLLFPGSQYLLVIRLLRVLRIFRLLKLPNFIAEANSLVKAIMRSSRKIGVFLFAIMILVTLFGSIMYVVEGPENGFTSIPKSMYWAIVTISTVGYGDVAPQTAIGQIISACLMLIAYSVIAVPTGIYAAEMAQTLKNQMDSRECNQCGLIGHLSDARFCRRCGTKVESSNSAVDSKP